jgi:hypothetical protein
MKSIILIILSAVLLLATGTNITKKEDTKPHMKKQAKITAKIEAEIAEKELKRLEKTKLREEKIQKVDSELKEKAIVRAEA